jgi:AcrR family transcriptional regulator
MARSLSPDDITAFRTRLCAVAERLFAEHGVAAIGIRQLAEELGCSPMTPYRYFRDKDEILAATRAAAFDRFAAALEAATAAAGDPVAQSRAAGQAYIHFALGEPNAYRLMFDLAQPGEEQYPELARAADRARRTMTTHVEALVAAGLLEGDPVLLGHVFWAAIHGAVSLQLAGKLDAGPDFETIRHEILRLLIRGATPKPSEGSP